MFAVYITTYLGNKLPKYYIGSTSIKNIKNRYRGTPTSKRYGNIFRSELKNNPHLFDTEIISKHSTRIEALEAERKIQIEMNVLSDSNFINMGIATCNSFCSLSGEKHWTHNVDYKEYLIKSRGLKWWNDYLKARKFGSESFDTKFGKRKAQEIKNKMSESSKGIPSKPLTGELNGMYGKTVYDVWLKKYGKNQADLKYKEWCNSMKGRTPHNKNNKQIIQLNKNNEVVNIYDGLADVIEKNPTFLKSNIVNVIKGKRKSANGYFWKYK